MSLAHTFYCRAAFLCAIFFCLTLLLSPREYFGGIFPTYFYCELTNVHHWAPWPHGRRCAPRTPPSWRPFPPFPRFLILPPPLLILRSESVRLRWPIVAFWIQLNTIEFCHRIATVGGVDGQKFVRRFSAQIAQPDFLIFSRSFCSGYVFLFSHVFGNLSINQNMIAIFSRSSKYFCFKIPILLDIYYRIPRGS